MRWVRPASGGDAGTGSGDDRYCFKSHNSSDHRLRQSARPKHSIDFDTNQQRALNKRVSSSMDTSHALQEFTKANNEFDVNAVNIAALFVILARTSRLDVRVDGSNGNMNAIAIKNLLNRLNDVIPESSGRVCANVLHALGQLEAREWWLEGVLHSGDDTVISHEQWKNTVASLVKRSGATAIEMNAQEIGNCYNGISRLDKFTALAMPTDGWIALSKGIITNANAAREVSGEGSVRSHGSGTVESSSYNSRSITDSRNNSSRNNKSPQFACLAAVLCLNALASDKMRRAVDVTPQHAFDCLLEIVLHSHPFDEIGIRSVDKLSEQGLANVLNACAKLPAAKNAVDQHKPSGWRLLLTDRLPSLSQRFGDQGLSVTMHALTLLGRDAHSAVTKNGWQSLQNAVQRLAPQASPQATAMLLNSSWKLSNEPGCSEFRLSPDTFRVLGQRAAEIVMDSSYGQLTSSNTQLDGQASFIVADAMGKLPEASVGFSLKTKEYIDSSGPTKDPWHILAKRLANSIVEKAKDGVVHVPNASIDAYIESTSANNTDWSSYGGPAASFHVLARVSELSDSLTTKKVWGDIGKALKVVVPTCNAEDCSRILNGYAKKRRNELVMVSTPVSTWKALGNRIAQLANENNIEPMHVATILDAVKKLAAVRETLDSSSAKSSGNNSGNSPDPWDDLARVITTSAFELEPLQVTNLVSALGWLEPLGMALSKRDGGWRVVAELVEARFESIAKGVNDSVTSSHRATPESIKWMEKTAAGLELVRGHAEFETYSDADDRAKLLELENRFREVLARRK